MVDFDSNVGLVTFVFNKYFYKYRCLEDDLIQEGLMGLWVACKTFDENRGTEFSTYAVKVVKNSMGMFLRKEAKHSKATSLDRVIDSNRGTTVLQIIDDTSEAPTSGTKEDIEVLLLEAEEVGCVEIVQMKLAGIKQVDIAKKMGVHPSTISEKLRCLYARTRKRLEK